MEKFQRENLLFDPIHGYIPFVSAPQQEGEATERDLIDHPWLQRLRWIHQLQTAWWVYPAAEHSRFQHVLGAMHLGSQAARSLYASLKEVCADVPPQPVVEALLRLAGLLHDVGHGPFGHFLDEHFLKHYGHTHETLGAHIIVHQLGDLIRRVRAVPEARLPHGSSIDPQLVAWLIRRPARQEDPDQIPRWLQLLRALLSGIYTIDNMDFVLRDAYMTGYSQRAFDLDRLWYYSMFTPQGLTIHDRGIDALLRFMHARADLFRSVYFHRTVRAIDLMLADLFRESRDLLFPGDPLEHLEQYREFTDASLLLDVARWSRSSDPRRRRLGRQWQELLDRRIRWKMVCQRTVVFGPEDAERASIFSDSELVVQKVRQGLPPGLRDLPLRVDLARHLFRPHTAGPTAGLNFLFDSSRGQVRPLHAHELVGRLPVSQRICRLYALSLEHAAELTRVLDALLAGRSEDDLTNM